jgi:hypothetical protein
MGIRPCRQRTVNSATNIFASHSPVCRACIPVEEGADLSIRSRCAFERRRVYVYRGMCGCAPA